MKTNNIIVIVLIAFFQLSFLQAQDMIKSKPETNVPLIVIEKFNQKFPSYEPVWFSQYQGRYNQELVFEGKFIFDKRYSSAVYDKDGNMIAFATKIEKNEVPQKAQEYMSKNFPNFYIAEALLVTRGFNEVTYELGIYVDNQFIIKVFSKDGEFIKSVRA
jgi:hypothetical protein